VYEQTCVRVWFAMFYEMAKASPRETAIGLLHDLHSYVPDPKIKIAFRWNFRTTLEGVVTEIRLRVDSTLVFKWSGDSQVYFNGVWTQCPNMEFLVDVPDIQHAQLYAGSCDRLSSRDTNLVFELVARHLRLHDIRSCVETYAWRITPGALNGNVWQPYVSALKGVWSKPLTLMAGATPPKRYCKLPYHVQWAQNTFAGHSGDFTSRGLEWLAMEENDGAIHSWGLAASATVVMSRILADYKAVTRVKRPPPPPEYVVAGKRRREHRNISVMELDITSSGGRPRKKRTKTYSRRDRLSSRKENRTPREAVVALFNTTPYTDDDSCLLYVTPDGRLMVRGTSRFMRMSAEFAASVGAKHAIRHIDKIKDTI